MQGVTAIGLIVALCLVVLFTDLSVPDLFASILAFIPTGWCILCVSKCHKVMLGFQLFLDQIKQTYFELING